MFDLVRYQYANGRPSRVELVSTDNLATPGGYATYYIQYNWHGDAIYFARSEGGYTGAYNLSRTTYDAWGIARLYLPVSLAAWNYYRWNGAWGYLRIDDLGLYYVHGRWYNPDTGLFLSPNEKGDYMYGGDGPPAQDPVNEMWVQFTAGALYQFAKNNIDAVVVVPNLYPPFREMYTGASTNLEAYVPDTYAAEVGRVFGSTVTMAQGLGEIQSGWTIGTGGTLVLCPAAAVQTGGASCVVPVLVGGAVLVHGLSVEGASLQNGGQIVASFATGIQTQGHHPWPQYLGGPKRQPLFNLRADLHEKFHAGLDKIFARAKGKVDWNSLTPAEQRDILESLLVYCQDFDADYGTRTFDAVVKALKSAGITPP